jgi:glycosyltransferase involved in cell wall biosynthesis
LALRPFGTLSRYTLKHRRRLLKRWYFAALERANVVDAAALHFTTVEERDEATQHGINILDRAHVIPPPWVQELPAVNATPSEIPHVAFIGRIDPVKNIEAILECWRRVLSAFPMAHLTIAGSGDATYVASLKQKVLLSGLSGTVSFPGFLDGDQKRELLSSASAFILPSHHENFGMAVLEAIASGVPVIVSRQVQLSRFVEAHNLGVVANTDGDEFSAAIIGLLTNPALRNRVRENGRSLVSMTYNPSIIGRQLEAMYLDALASSASRIQNPR